MATVSGVGGPTLFGWNRDIVAAYFGIEVYPGADSRASNFRRRMHVTILIVFIAALLLTHADNVVAQAGNPTRAWVLNQLHGDMASPLALDRISSAIYGLISDRGMAEQPDTRKALAQLDSLVRDLDLTVQDCGDLVNIHFITGFLNMAGIRSDTDQTNARLLECLDGMDALNRASGLFALCRFPSNRMPRNKLSRAAASIEALQRADGSFGVDYGLRRYYLTTHAVLALYICNGNPDSVRRGQVYLRNTLPAIKRAGFLDGLLESLLVLRKTGMAIPDVKHYTAYLRSRIREDGSICFFDRPVCKSDVHATSLLLEFLQEFDDES